MIILRYSKYPQLFVRVKFYIFWRRNYMFAPKNPCFAHAYLATFKNKKSYLVYLAPGKGNVVLASKIIWQQ